MGHYVGRYRVTIQEAAERLGVKEGAIRKRIERGTIRSEKEVDNGRVYVYVDEPPVEAPIDDRDAGHDNGYDTSYDTGYDAGYDMLVKSQQEEIVFLRRELERKDALLLNMTEVMKALNPPQEAASEPRETGVIASEERGREDVPPEPQEAEGSETVSAASTKEGEGIETPLREEHRSWWRRMFGA